MFQTDIASTSSTALPPETAYVCFPFQAKKLADEVAELFRTVLRLHMKMARKRRSKSSSSSSGSSSSSSAAGLAAEAAGSLASESEDETIEAPELTDLNPQQLSFWIAHAFTVRPHLQCCGLNSSSSSNYLSRVSAVDALAPWVRYRLLRKPMTTFFYISMKPCTRCGTDPEVSLMLGVSVRPPFVPLLPHRTASTRSRSFWRRTTQSSACLPSVSCWHLPSSTTEQPLPLTVFLVRAPAVLAAVKWPHHLREALTRPRPPRLRGETRVDYLAAGAAAAGNMVSGCVCVQQRDTSSWFDERCECQGHQAAFTVKLTFISSLGINLAALCAPDIFWWCSLCVLTTGEAELWQPGHRWQQAALPMLGW